MTVSATYTFGAAPLVVIPPDDGAPQAITANTQHLAEALDLFIEEYKLKPRLAALLQSFVDQVQEIEDANVQLLFERAIDTATGRTLEIIGDIVGQENPGLTDENYRTLIRARVKVNNSDGTAPQMIEILQLLAATLAVPPALAPVIYNDLPPAAFELHLDVDIGTLDPILIFGMLNEARGAGIKLQFIFYSQPEAETFQFATALTPIELETTEGFSSTITPATGGKFANVKG